MSSNESNRRRHPTHRRHKNEIPNNFVCGDKKCDKKYGSNAALYTHIKTKHNGLEPPGTVRPAQSAAKGQKGRPKAIESNQADTQDALQQTLGCNICKQKDGCVCPDSFDTKLITLLSEESFINFIKSVGNFGEHKQSAESINEWVRSVDGEILSYTPEKIKDRFQMFCKEKSFSDAIAPKLLDFLSYSSKYWAKDTEEELYRGLFAIICIRKLTDIVRFIEQDSALKRFNNLIKKNRPEFESLVKVVVSGKSLRESE